MNSKRLVLILAAALGLLAASSASAVSTVRSPGGLLDRNRGWVLDTPDIHNIFWDDNWAKHNPWSRHAVNTATEQLIDNHYFGSLAQYGVGTPTLGGSHDSAAAPECAPIAGAGERAPVELSSATLLVWITCVASHLHTQSRFPASNDLYVVYLPVRTTVVDGPSIGSFTVAGIKFPGVTLPLSRSCASYTGYHFFGLSARGPFAYVVIPARCALHPLPGQTPYEALTEATSHELVEAMVDPIFTQGWIDDGFAGPQLFTAAEAADLCNPGSGSQPGSFAYVGSTAVPGDHVQLAPYWSNSKKACVTQ